MSYLAAPPRDPRKYYNRAQSQCQEEKKEFATGVECKSGEGRTAVVPFFFIFNDLSQIMDIFHAFYWHETCIQFPLRSGWVQEEV
jgi:hypothetical protein